MYISRTRRLTNIDGPPAGSRHDRPLHVLSYHPHNLFRSAVPVSFSPPLALVPHQNGPPPADSTRSSLLTPPHPPGDAPSANRHDTSSQSVHHPVVTARRTSQCQHIASAGNAHLNPRQETQQATRDDSIQHLISRPRYSLQCTPQILHDSVQYTLLDMLSNGPIILASHFAAQSICYPRTQTGLKRPVTHPNALRAPSDCRQISAFIVSLFSISHGGSARTQALQCGNHGAKPSYAIVAGESQRSSSPFTNCCSYWALRRLNLTVIPHRSSHAASPRTDACVFFGTTLAGWSDGGTLFRPALSPSSQSRGQSLVQPLAEYSIADQEAIELSLRRGGKPAS
ncbi:hypothetical protein EVG20_g1843 [Dentipellis fragilis]|uniref:Uncharacterized protein n=1 Tax=Dentipellis fragilis TaxID=205917 RepID=A0A4Y9ZAX9_9AGAM|nr:hypothetical protein EVG20_g1843 [Dentipellis fragilis]